MKIYFTSSIRGKKFYEENYLRIYKTIESLGYKHVDKTLFEHSIINFYKELESGSPQTYVDFYNKTIENLNVGDVNIFECSLPSLGIGFQVEKSLENDKPTIVLYLKEHIPHFLAGTNNDKLILKSYTPENVKEVLVEAIEEAKQRADKRFNFFISPYLLSYLNKVSKEQGVTKSMFIRGLILEHMKRTPK